MTDRAWVRVRAVWAVLALAVIGAQMPLHAQAQSPEQKTVTASSPEYKRGRLLFIQCRACHDLQPSDIEKIGPNLAGLIGRKAAADAAFAYSPALQAAASKLVWDKATLDRWIEKPAAVIPGNTMAFAGISNPADRAALLVYLEAETSAR